MKHPPPLIRFITKKSSNKAAPSVTIVFTDRINRHRSIVAESCPTHLNATAPVHATTHSIKPMFGNKINGRGYGEAT